MKEPLSLDRIERLVCSALRNYQYHLDWPDIKQEAMVAAWQALQAAKGAEAEASTVAWNAARWSAGNYLRQQRPIGFKRNGAGAPAGCSLEAIPEPPTPQPTRSAWDWGWIEGIEMPDRYRRLFEAHYRHGISQSRLAAAEGVTSSRVQQILEAVRERIRRSLGLTKQPVTDCWHCGKRLIDPNPRRRYCGQQCKQTAADRRRGHQARKSDAQP